MKILHINAGQEEGGGKSHILSLLTQIEDEQVELLVLEDGIIAKEARQAGIKVHILGQQSRYHLTVLKKLIDFINSGNYDIVHTHGARANFLMNLIRKKIKTKWVITVHSDPKLDFLNRGIRGKIFSTLNIKSLKRSDGVIVVTNKFQNLLVSLGVEKDKICVIYNGVDFDYELRPNKKNEVFTITYVARLHPIKGHELLLYALKESHLSSFHLNIIGDGELRNKLEVKTTELGLKNAVTFFGIQNNKAIELILEKTDLTVLTSYSEGFPLTLLESARQSVPFISTNVGDISKIIPNASLGWLIPINDKKALTTSLEEAYTEWENGILKEKGQQLHDFAADNFSIQKMCQKTILFYQKIKG